MNLNARVHVDDRHRAQADQHLGLSLRQRGYTNVSCALSSSLSTSTRSRGPGHPTSRGFQYEHIPGSMTSAVLLAERVALEIFDHDVLLTRAAIEDDGSATRPATMVVTELSEDQARMGAVEADSITRLVSVRCLSF